MTSHQFSANKNAAKYDFKSALKSIIAPSIASFLISAYSFVFSPLSQYMMYLDMSSFNRVKIQKQIALMLVYSNLGEYVDFGTSLGWVFLFLGAVFAMFGFSFVMRKRTVNVFFSTSVDRRTLYKNRTLAVVLMTALSIAVPIIADIIINVYFIGHFGYVLECAVLLFAQCFVYTLTGFAITAIAAAFCTTIVESAFFAAGIAVMPTAIVYLIDSLCSVFLRGYNHRNLLLEYYNSSVFSKPSLFHYTSIINPLIYGKAYKPDYAVSENMINFTYRAASSQPSNIMSDSFYYDSSFVLSRYSGYERVSFDYILPIIVWAVISSLMIIIARQLFIKIKAEDAGVHGTKPIASGLFAAECAIVLLALWINNYIGSGIVNTVFVTAIGVLIVLISYFVIISICRRTIKHKVKELITPCTVAAAAVVLITVFSSGFFGYSAYVPEAQEIEKAVITTGVTDFTSAEILTEPCTDTFDGDLFYSEIFDNAIGLFTDEDDLKALTDISKRIVEKTDNMTGSSVCICYELKNGKFISRYYDSTDYDVSYSILSLRDSKAAREELTYLLAGEPKDTPITKALESSAIYTDDFFGYEGELDTAQLFNKGFVYIVNSDNISGEKTIKNTPEFRKALLDDLLSQTYEQRFKPEEAAIGGILFSSYDYNGESDLDILASDIGYYIYPSMTNTVNYLKSTGEYELFAANDEIESVTIESCKNIREELFKSWSSDSIFSHLFAAKNYTPYTYDDIYYDDSYDYDDYDMYSMPEYFKNGRVIENAEQIDELLAKARIFYFSNDDDCMVMIKYKKAGYVSKLIPANELPQWAALQTV